MMAMSDRQAPPDHQAPRDLLDRPDLRVPLAPPEQQDRPDLQDHPDQRGKTDSPEPPAQQALPGHRGHLDLPGPAGPAGPAGPPGPPGPPGTAAAPNVYVRTAMGAGRATARCDTNDIATGGGFFVSGPPLTIIASNPGLQVAEPPPIPPTMPSAWTVQREGSGSITAYVICIDRP